MAIKNSAAEWISLFVYTNGPKAQHMIRSTKHNLSRWKICHWHDLANEAWFLPLLCWIFLHDYCLLLPKPHCGRCHWGHCHRGHCQELRAGGKLDPAIIGKPGRRLSNDVGMRLTLACNFTSTCRSPCLFCDHLNRIWNLHRNCSAFPFWTLLSCNLAISSALHCCTISEGISNWYNLE